MTEYRAQFGLYYPDGTEVPIKVLEGVVDDFMESCNTRGLFAAGGCTEYPWVDAVTDQIGHWLMRCISILRRLGVKCPRYRGLVAITNEDGETWTKLFHPLDREEKLQ